MLHTIKIVFLIICIGLVHFSAYATDKSISSPNANPLLKFDFSDFQVASVENRAGPTGVTLFYFPKGAQAAVDIRGGSVGTFFTQEKMKQGEAWIDGVAFAGGGILGLEAVAGAISSLFTQRQQNAFSQMPLISGGVIFDYTPRGNYIYPDKTLGQQAFSALRTGEFKIGKFGAGASATVGKLFGQYVSAGQGAAFAQWGDTKIAVFTVVNAVGVILNEKGDIIHGLAEPLSMTDYVNKAGKLLARNEAINFDTAGNTTLTIVITNQKLAPRHLQQLGRTVHHALSQVIYPYASILDGDMVYTISTGSVESDLYSPGANIETDLNLKQIYLGLTAGALAKQAVWSAVNYHPSVLN